MSSETALFKDRREAGRTLAAQLEKYANRDDVLVLALPRGGVPVGFEVAQALHAPLDIFLVRKLGVPGQEELAMGAIASGGMRVINPDIVRSLGIPAEMVEVATHREEAELARREQAYRGNRSFPRIEGKTVILVDDGLATGASMYAAVLALRQKKPARIVVAVPVAAQETCHTFSQLVDEIICAYTPAPFYGVGAWYEDFSQISDDEVRELLELAANEQSS
jgi:putative phosphoribosyl transferase